MRAYLECRRHKRKTAEAAKFEADCEKNILALENELGARAWQPGIHSCFAITDPKLREIWAAPFRDRIVHHLLVSRLEPVFEQKFIFHSYACRKGKGAHKAIYYLERAMRSLGAGADKKAAPRPRPIQPALPGFYGSNARRPRIFYLQIDIRSFFVSIDRRVLFAIIAKAVKNPDILWLAEKIIFQDCASHCVVKGARSLLRAVPPHKSLFCAPPDKGLPIGNLTSQFFANVYLNELDQFVKHTLKCRRYFRYMDDLLLLSPSEPELLAWKKAISAFLRQKLALELHPKKAVLRRIDSGINFCGYIIKPEYLQLRRLTVKKLKQKLWRFNRGLCLPPDCDPLSALTPDYCEDLRHVLASLNSYYGLLKPAGCFGLRKKIYEQHFGILKWHLRPANRNYGYFIWNEL